MTGDGMCGVFIPDRVLAGWWRSHGRRVTGCGWVAAQQVVERGRYISSSAGGIILHPADVSFS